MAIKLGLAENKNEEHFIRQRILWAYNDRIRNGNSIFDDQSDEIRWLENCYALIDLLDTNDVNQKIAVAELKRNLGLFDQCLMIINQIETNNLKRIKEKFVSECNKKNRWVILLYPDYEELFAECALLNR